MVVWGEGLGLRGVEVVRGLKVKTSVSVFWGSELRLSAVPEEEIHTNVGKVLFPINVIKLKLRGPARCMLRSNLAFTEKAYPLLNKASTWYG